MGCDLRRMGMPSQLTPGSSGMQVTYILDLSKYTWTQCLGWKVDNINPVFLQFLNNFVHFDYTIDISILVVLFDSEYYSIDNVSSIPYIDIYSGLISHSMNSHQNITLFMVHSQNAFQNEVYLLTMPLIVSIFNNHMNFQMIRS